jgi:hypothetical protein
MFVFWGGGRPKMMISLISFYMSTAGLQRKGVGEFGFFGDSINI